MLSAFAEDTRLETLNARLQNKSSKNKTLLYTGFSAMAVTMVLATLIIVVIATMACRIRRRQTAAQDAQDVKIFSAVGSGTNDLV